MALKNYKVAGSLDTVNKNIIVPAVAVGQRVAVTSIVLHNPSSTDAITDLSIDDGTNLYQFAQGTVTAGESYFYDVKIVLGEGESIVLGTNNADMVAIVSGDEA